MNTPASLCYFFTEPDAVKEYLEASQLDDEEESSIQKYIEGWDEWAILEHRDSGLLPIPETYSIAG